MNDTKYVGRTEFEGAIKAVQAKVESVLLELRDTVNGRFETIKGDLETSIEEKIIAIESLVQKADKK